ncbi:MAG: NAD(+) synthase [Planctomycetales bacterium]|nr:NAD(+) synthase [Planctomycetales bacterium]
MKLVKVAAAVLNQTALDWDGNKRNILAAIQTARRQGVSLLCLPELCITGYGCEDAFHSAGVHRMAERVLLEIVPETAGLIVSVGLPVMQGGAVFNTSCLIADGQILGFVGKQNLAGDGIHYEPRWFKPWPNDLQATVEVGGSAYPLGDLMFDIGGVRIGFEICEDAWVGSRPGAEFARRGVDVLLNPSASHFAFGKHEIRKRFVLEGSRAFHVSYVYANLLGNEAGRAIYDGDAMIAADGRMLATGPRFSFADFHLTTAVIDIDATRMSRARTSSYVPQILREQPDVVRRAFDFPVIAPEPANLTTAAWEAGSTVKEEEFARAVSLALFDYMRKSRSRGFVVSLSGGADSAAVSTLCALLVSLGVSQLGRDVFLEKLAHAGPWDDANDVQAIVQRLLLCVYQATSNSGEITREAARGVAESLGAEFLLLDVDPLFRGYCQLIESAIGRSLDWKQDDIALQNIQARVRSPSVWMLANLRSALLLSTSNRSEAAVGYATMDGDTSGGLSPIAGIDKAFLRRWLRWMETTGPEEHGPLPSLGLINALPPTAELRPPAASQTDEADLMPYDVLDAIERAAIRDKLTPLEVYQRLRAEPDAAPPEQLAQWIERFFKLWSRNQWKRERYAPSFHLDDENLDPKTWCRFPILSGGFVRELAELRAWMREEQVP